MSEYDSVVEKQRLLLEAEKWAKGVKMIHSHSLTSMHYETQASADDIEENGPVTDTQYNNGTIHRYRNGKLLRIIGKELKGDDLLDSYVRFAN